MNFLDQFLGGGVQTTTGGNNGDIFASLTDIAEGLVTSVASNAAGALQGRIEGTINNAPRSQNTAPTPDLTAVAARPGVSTFTDAKAFGVSLPLLVVGGGALLYLLVRR